MEINLDDLNKQIQNMEKMLLSSAQGMQGTHNLIDGTALDKMKEYLSEVDKRHEEFKIEISKKMSDLKMLILEDSLGMDAVKGSHRDTLVLFSQIAG